MCVLRISILDRAPRLPCQTGRACSEPRHTRARYDKTRALHNLTVASRLSVAGMQRRRAHALESEPDARRRDGRLDGRHVLRWQIEHGLLGIECRASIATACIIAAAVINQDVRLGLRGREHVPVVCVVQLSQRIVVVDQVRRFGRVRLPCLIDLTLEVLTTSVRSKILSTYCTAPQVAARRGLLLWRRAQVTSFREH